MNLVRAWLVAFMTSGLPMHVYAGDLQGVWLFQKEVNATSAGEVVEVPGPAYEGILIYTSDGYVSVNLMPKDRSWSIENASLEELRQTVGQGSSTGYAGRYEVDVAKAQVTHIPSVSIDPADEARRLVRSYVLEGDTLKLSGTWTYHGKNLIFTVVWARAQSPNKTIEPTR